MAVPESTEDRYDNSADNGTSYTLTSTDDAAVSGQVFVDMSEHTVVFDGHREPRPRLLLRFFGLAVNGRWLGAPQASVAFYPNATARQPGIAVVVLGEPGGLHIDLGRQLTAESDDIIEAVTAVVQVISQRFLTDLRVAKYWYSKADERRQRASRAYELATMRQDIASRRSSLARAEFDAAHALYRATQNNADA
ncbi:hypothetical protein [Nocardia seriolae]|uniref:Uncharacterized protein n=1 Tax=Nocardia seriolae TaxID=37332 RepID=A0ABC9Z5H0_9NOCA|nr:hypothetical protein [Nocardia seriolae]APA96664.1 hypothetical protein NS506_02602 [Nocardia seriolae]QOW30744.1 hypothetical protein IMZ23_21470 [Nocardia seriolae]QUN15329.1 hypothetical protein KEC46_23440 [Nocardia seriolae]WNJ57676.1 hypothetical protein RMO66_30415 [Nocardia seriolae]BEK93851.1 hypothetical protein NSER024013_17570 [Nocardia seriolae]